jgi:ATP-dependent Clp protease adaptor protein ClpS
MDAIPISKECNGSFVSMLCWMPARMIELRRFKREFMANEDDKNSNGQLILDSRTKTKKPSMYKVIMLNDDYTPMEFVVHVLQKFFGRSADEATQIMLNVHQRGVGVCGVYSFEIAESKAQKTIDYARKNDHPLQLQLEKE